MILIAHRGNVFGPNVQNENSPKYLENTVAAGFDIEFDIRLINEQFFLGHDQPKYQISEDWLFNYLKVSWVHCKNYEALAFFANSKTRFNYFWHENDKYTIVSNGKVWMYPGEDYIPGAVIVLPELNGTIEDIRFGKKVYAVCSDFVGKLSVE